MIFCKYYQNKLIEFVNSSFYSLFCNYNNETCGCNGFCLYDFLWKTKNNVTKVRDVIKCSELFNRDDNIKKTTCTDIAMCNKQQIEFVSIKDAQAKCKNECSKFEVNDLTSNNNPINNTYKILQQYEYSSDNNLVATVMIILVFIILFIVMILGVIITKIRDIQRNNHNISVTFSSDNELPPTYYANENTDIENIYVFDRYETRFTYPYETIPEYEYEDSETISGIVNVTESGV